MLAGSFSPLEEQPQSGPVERASSGDDARSEVGWGARVRGPALALVALFLAFAPLCYDRGLHDAFQLPKRALFVTAALAGAGLILVARASLRRTVLPREALLLITFVGVVLVGLGGAIAPEQGVGPVRDLLALGCWWLLGFFLVRRDRDLAWILGGVAVAAAVTARIGLLQSKGVETLEAMPVDMRLFAEGLGSQLRLFAEILGFNYADRPPLFERLPPTSDPPGSLAGHVNVVAETVVLGLFATFGLLATLVRRAVRRAGAQRVLAIGGAILLVPLLWTDARFLLVSGSRAAWLAAVAGGALLAVLAWKDLANPRLRKRVALFGGGGVAALLIAVLLASPYIKVTGRAGDREVSLWTRVSEAFDWTSGTERERSLLWEHTRAMIEDHPWLGVGAGNWKIEYPAYALAFSPHPADKFSLLRQPERVHREPLQLRAETGLLGTLVMGAFMLVAVLRLGLRVLPRGPGADLRRAAGCCVLSVLLLSLVAFPLQFPVTGAVTFVLLGGAAGLGVGGRRATFLKVPRPALVLTGALLLVCCVVAGFDLNGRIKASRGYRMASYDRLAARIPVQDRSAAMLTGRQLLQRALQRLDAATAREPSSYRYHLKRAECLWDLGLGDDALSAFDRVLELHPNLVQAILLKAELHQRLGRQQDLADAYALIFERAFRIMPWSPEVNYACGQHLMLMAERIPTHADEYRANAVKFFERAASPKVREYAPDARLALASAMLENGNAPNAITDVMALAERDASENPTLLARCARFYADPRLETFRGGGLFGPAGAKTQATWQKVLGLRRGRDQEARTELTLVPWYQWVARNRTGEKPDLDPMVTQLRAHLAANPQALVPRYYLARILEDLGQLEKARMEWGNLYRYVRSGARISPFWKRKIEYEAADAARRLVGNTPVERK